MIQPRSTPPCPGCGKTMRFQQTLDKKEMFFGCSQFLQCRRALRVPPITILLVSLSVPSCTAVQLPVIQATHMDVESVSSEDTFSMWEVPAVPFVFWNQKAESAQSNSSLVSRPTEEGHGRSTNQKTAGCFDTKVSQSKKLQRACLWDHKALVTDAMWEAAVQHFGSISIGSCFLMEIDKRCPQPSVYDNSLVQNKDGAWEPALKTDVSERRCRVISKSPWWNLSCDDDVWLREQATMNRVQNRLEDEHLEQIHSQRSHDDFCCYFADSKTLQLRPASTHEMTRKNRICALDLRGAPARESETIRQQLKSTPP